MKNRWPPVARQHQDTPVEQRAAQDLGARSHIICLVSFFTCVSLSLYIYIYVYIYIYISLFCC